MKKIILPCIVISLLLCSCGKNSSEVTDTMSKTPIRSAGEYEVEWVDTSKLELVDNILPSVVDSQMYCMQSIFVSRNEDGRTEHKYEEISYDMVSNEWSGSKVFPATDKINRIGLGSMFRMSPDGIWYFLLFKWDENLKKYDKAGLSRLTEEGEVEEIKISEDIVGEPFVVDSYMIRSDGKICIKVCPESRYEKVSLPEMNVVLYDPETETFEYGGDLLMGFMDMITIENEYFYRSVAGGKCGYSVKTKDTGDVVQREIFCEGDTPEGGWTNDVFSIRDTYDDTGNLYVLNAGGIYGGYYKDSELKNIVPVSVLDELGLSSQTGLGSEKMLFVSDFWRGAETEYADFYVFITDMTDDVHIKVTLAHIKKKDV